ncbi:15853_t:CDS:2 [Racocetra fulgida]|uniref:15853_t:CDS:1 n=1 Tax=Racocetra fulgida TaxID=60492 RepID=A0A9N9A814_9GLOM|nr:15853_t:CDS:2 [Racocetra fulgida]
MNIDIDEQPYLPGYLKVDDSQAESVPTDYPVPPEVLLYYFEINIIDKGEDGYIGVGFARDLEILDILPGLLRWCPGTMGYHGDDGCKFFENGFGTKYGPLYSTGDTIGCCAFFSDPRIVAQVEDSSEIQRRHIMDVFDENLYTIYDFV